MQNYQGLLNPSSFAQNNMAPQGASYWMQYAQSPSPLSLPVPLSQSGAGGGSGVPTPPGTPPGPTPPVTPPVLPPGTPPRPTGPAHGGDTGWGQQQNQGQTPVPRQSVGSKYPTTIGGFNVNGDIPRALAQEIFAYYGDQVNHGANSGRQGQGANTAYYKEWLPRPYWDMVARMNYFPEPFQKQRWNEVRDRKGYNPQASMLPTWK